jgi:hypothetical protein
MPHRSPRLRCLAGYRFAKGHSHLEDRCRFVVEVFGGHTGNRSAEFSQGAKDSEAVFGISFDKDIEILCASGLGMDANRVAADDQIFNTVRIEKFEKLFLILEHRLFLYLR